MKSTKLNFILAAVMFAIPAALTLTGQPQQNSVKPIHYSVKNLGTLGGVQGSFAKSINDIGWVVGIANLTGDTEEHAALWQDGIVTDLGTLGGHNSSVDFPVKNNNGLVVGFAQTPETDPLGENFCTWTCTPSGVACNGSNQLCRGFRWRNGLMKPLGTLGGNNSAAIGANNLGLVVGVAENTTQDPNCVSPQVLDYEAVVWWGNTIHELPRVPGDAIGAAAALNDNGLIAGATGMCGQGVGMLPIFVHAVLWKNDSPTDLGNLGGAFNNIAYAINNQGQIVGASDLAGDSTGHAFLWQNGAMTDLGTLTSDFSSAASSINNKGQVVGQSCNSDFSICRAFLWQGGVMTDLNTLIPSSSPLFVILSDDINDIGEIVGTALDQSGVPVAFLAVPCDEQHVGEQGCQDAAQSAIGMERPKVALPESVRTQLQHRMRFGRL